MQENYLFLKASFCAQVKLITGVLMLPKSILRQGLSANFLAYEGHLDFLFKITGKNNLLLRNPLYNP